MTTESGGRKGECRNYKIRRGETPKGNTLGGVLVGLTATSNSQLLHSDLKSGALHSQTGGGAFGTGNDPMRFLERREYLLAFGVFKNALHAARGLGASGTVEFGRGSAVGFEIGERYLQHRAGAQDRGARDYVLQFADVTGPVVIAEHTHRLGRDAFDLPVHAPGE